MKTALELLNGDIDLFGWAGHVECQCCKDARNAIDLVAKRAREETREEAARVAIDAAADGFHDRSASDCADRMVAAIRALPVE